MRESDTGSQPDLFSTKPGVPVLTGDLRRAAEICARWETDYRDFADQNRHMASVPLTELGVVAAAVGRLCAPKPDAALSTDPIAFLESWLDGGKGGAVAPKILTPGQGRALLDGIRARLAAAGVT